MSLRVATAGLDLMADALRAQDAEVTTIDWRPPARRATPTDVATAHRRLRRRPRRRRQRASRSTAAGRPAHDRGRRAGGRADPGPRGAHGAARRAADRVGARCAPPSATRCAAPCVFEGWASDRRGRGRRCWRAARSRLAPAHSLDAAGAMSGVISPSMACWAARDEVGGTGVGFSPLNDGPGDAFWLGVGSPRRSRRQRADGRGGGAGVRRGAAGPRPDRRLRALTPRASRWATTATCATRRPRCCCCARCCPRWPSTRPRAVLPTARLSAPTGTSP